MSGIRLACMWPGFSSAWYRGSGSGVLIALASAWAACLLLLATWVWPEWFSVWLVRSLWTVGILAWLVASVHAHMQFSRLFDSSSSEQSSALEDAQEAYLRGNWFEAEALLLDLLHRQPRDAEALLLLAGVLRHTKRWQPALRRLNQLELLDSAGPWRFEIGREKRLIEKEIAEDTETVVLSSPPVGELPNAPAPGALALDGSPDDSPEGVVTDSPE